ncbi:hypothetical protein RhiirB3_446721 [Rhizophagus irregularis]|nr:hypothetical protein RhiirB3_446721 [Rhizophagus irregularis]
MINCKEISKSVKSIKSVNLIYITQVIDENNKMKSWSKLTAEAGRSSKGKTPDMYDEYRSQQIFHNYWGDVFREENLNCLMEIDNRFTVLRTIFIKGKGIVKLKNKFFKGLDCDEDTIYLYTDASKKENKNSIGWVKMNTSNLKVLDKEYLRISNNIELELMAIFIGFPSLNTAEAKVEIYTDNMTVYKIWKQLFNRE